MNFLHRLAAITGGVMVLAAMVLGVIWTQFRVYVPSDRCLVLVRKTGSDPADGAKIASPGEKGIQRDTLGPGRYFLNPFVWDWELKPLIEISAGDPASWKENYAAVAADTDVPQLAGEWPQIGILVNKVGKPAPAGAEVVDEGFQGIQKQVLTPGTYRINPYVYEVRTMPATVVPLGYCGVVTSQLGEMPGSDVVAEVAVGPDGQPVKGKPKVVQKLAEAGQRGVRREVLPPGIYYLNPYLYKVQIVQVGYNQISQVAVRTRLKSGDQALIQAAGGRGAGQPGHENVAQANQVDPRDISTHISFPSKDGFSIDVEVTVVWGRHPQHIPEMINRFGDIAKIKEIIISQMRSICRNLGSEYESTDFIRGEKRELYQRAVTDTLRRVCRERDIDILIALIHNIEVHGSPAAEREGMDLKTTIQRGFIAREQEITKQAERETAVTRAKLETAKVAVDIAREQITSETRKRVAEIKATGEKEAQQINAQRDLAVATLEKEIAALDAETTRLLGRARTDVERLKNQAEADGQRLMVQAFGSGTAYNLYTFAQSFAPDAIRLIFAGEGTFWTDLSRLEDAGAVKLLQQESHGQPAPPARNAPPAERGAGK